MIGNKEFTIEGLTYVHFYRLLYIATYISVICVIKFMHHQIVDVHIATRAATNIFVSMAKISVGTRLTCVI